VHDARDPYGFTVTFPNGETLTVVTDTGIVTQQIFAQLAASDYLVIEANHDCDMLYRNPRYPPDLKQRIRSSVGHLSNDQCLEALGRLTSTRLKKLVFAHLSAENNSPEIVQRTADRWLCSDCFAGKAFIASQESPLSIVLD
jgi:phosphoribosyl 1,2-cyclic phosphodiesterase